MCILLVQVLSSWITLMPILYLAWHWVKARVHAWRAARKAARAKAGLHDDEYEYEEEEGEGGEEGDESEDDGGGEHGTAGGAEPIAVSPGEHGDGETAEHLSYGDNMFATSPLPERSSLAMLSRSGPSALAAVARSGPSAVVRSGPSALVRSEPSAVAAVSRSGPLAVAAVPGSGPSVSWKSMTGRRASRLLRLQVPEPALDDGIPAGLPATPGSCRSVDYSRGAGSARTPSGAESARTPAGGGMESVRPGVRMAAGIKGLLASFSSALSPHARQRPRGLQQQQGQKGIELGRGGASRSRRGSMLGMGAGDGWHEAEGDDEREEDMRLGPSWVEPSNRDEQGKRGGGGGGVDLSGPSKSAGRKRRKKKEEEEADFDAAGVDAIASSLFGGI